MQPPADNNVEWAERFRQWERASCDYRNDHDEIKEVRWALRQSDFARGEPHRSGLIEVEAIRRVRARWNNQWPVVTNGAISEQAYARLAVDDVVSVKGVLFKLTNFTDEGGTACGEPLAGGPTRRLPRSDLMKPTGTPPMPRQRIRVAVEASPEPMKPRPVTGTKTMAPRPVNGVPSTRSTIGGHSPTSLVRWMGAQGWSVVQAFYVIRALGPILSTDTVRIQLRRGQIGRGVPTVNPENRQALEKLRPR